MVWAWILVADLGEVHDVAEAVGDLLDGDEGEDACRSWLVR